MSKTASASVGETRALIVEAARTRLLGEGHGGLSTRKVADTAGVPLSQLHYHFGSKQGLLLAVLEEENRRRLERHAQMYSSDRPLWQRYEQACDFLEDDLDSGYVRVLQEMIAKGWADEAIAESVRALLGGWYELLTEVAEEAEATYGPLGPFTAREAATLIGNAFIGSEALILLGFDRDDLPIRAALRRVGVLIRELEESSQAQRGEHARTGT
ncbi:MAG TPA: TetR/AcrR family transcriptional regulator [Acidimicrobiales bacterium]|nr:TetR/AcrR family transcriptional regulator [Acidimicrobiales bacterium]